MIPYEELDRALARWKARTQGGGAVDTDHEVTINTAAVMTSVPAHTEERGSVPQRMSGFSESTGELDLDNEEVVETFDEENER